MVYKQTTRPGSTHKQTDRLAKSQTLLWHRYSARNQAHRDHGARYRRILLSAPCDFAIHAMQSKANRQRM